MEASLSHLVVYPVKSCRGIEVDAWDLAEHGLRHDREFMVVGEDGSFLTQRELPQMATIQTRLDDEVLTITSPGAGSVAIDLNELQGPTSQIRVWEHHGPARDQGQEAADLLTMHLGLPARLVRMGPEHARVVTRPQASGAPVSFSDGYPLLLITEASLEDLNSRIAESGGSPVPHDRFRANLVVSGTGPFAEDSWSSISIDGITFDVAKPCTRCTVTRVDQATGERLAKEPLKTLATFRRTPEGGVTFGQNLAHRTTGRVRRGSRVDLR